MRYRVAAATFVLALVGCIAARPPAPLAIAGADLSAHAGRAPAKMLLDDEFSAPQLNTKLWFTCYSWAMPGQRCTNGGNLELEWYHAQNVSLAGGILNLTAKAHPATSSHPFTSGMVQTGGTASTPATFAFTYGYAEIRAKLPRGAGVWPAFWLVQANRQWPPEIDIMEYQGVQPAVDVVTTHWSDAQGNHQQSGTGVNTGTNLSQAYHTYACDWEPNAIVWYFDGKPIKRFTQKRWIPSKPMIVILNLAIGGWEPGQRNPRAADFPVTFAIDYVRVWSKRPL
jgi:beta-glucanase (GH16 family)